MLFRSSAACSDCGAGKYSPTVGAYSDSTCASCPDNSSSVGGSSLPTSCLCDPGFTGADGDACSLCAAGKYKNGIGSAACSDCGAGTYSATLAASAVGSCLSCPANSHSPPGSTAEGACACTAGYSGPGGGPCAAPTTSGAPETTSAAPETTSAAPAPSFTTPAPTTSSTPPSGAQRTTPGLGQGVFPAIVLLWVGVERGR